MKRIYLKERFSENHETVYYSIDEDRIETLKEHETYDQYGQEVGHYNSGDYSIHNSSCDLAELCKAAISEKFNINEDDFDLCGDEIDYMGDYEINKDEINAFIKKFEDENSNYTEVKGFNYWNGNNWKTVTTYHDYYETSHEVIEDKEIIAKLDKAIEEMEFEKEGFGKREYLGNGYRILETQFANDWAEYTLIEE